LRARLLAIAAKELGIDRVAFRRRNLIAESEMPYPLAKVMPLALEAETDSGDYAATLDRCLDEIGWSAKTELQGKLVDGRYHGLGGGCSLRGGGARPREDSPPQ